MGTRIKKTGRKLDNKKKKVLESKKGIKRLVGKDVPGECKLPDALRQIPGIGHTMSKVLAVVLAEKLGVAVDVEVGDLDEKQTEKLEYYLQHLHELDELPEYLYNRQKDPKEGYTVHFVGTDVKFSMNRDIEGMKQLYSWKGFRHAYGQKVRGQRTKNTGRAGTSLGVKRKKK